VEHGALKALDLPVGGGPARLDPRVLDAQSRPAIAESRLFTVLDGGTA